MEFKECAKMAGFYLAGHIYCYAQHYTVTHNAT